MYQNNSGFLSRIPPVTKNLIIINALLFLATTAAPRFGWDLYKYLGLHYVSATDFNPAQFVTYMFMHGNFTHVLFNMFAVFMFGSVLEQVWGPKRYLIFYFVAGIGAGLIQEIAWYVDLREILALSENELINIGGGHIVTKEIVLNLLVTVGASGSVFGLLLAYGMLFPNSAIYLMFIPIPIKAKYFVIGYGVLELTIGVANFSGDKIAHFAHLGGMLFGFFLIWYWKRKDIKDKNINNDQYRFFR